MGFHSSSSRWVWQCRDVPAEAPCCAMCRVTPRCAVCVGRHHDVPREGWQQQGDTEMFAHGAGSSVQTKQKKHLQSFLLKPHILSCR